MSYNNFNKKLLCKPVNLQGYLLGEKIKKVIIDDYANLALTETGEIIAWGKKNSPYYMYDNDTINDIEQFRHSAMADWNLQLLNNRDTIISFYIDNNSEEPEFNFPIEGMKERRRRQYFIDNSYYIENHIGIKLFSGDNNDTSIVKYYEDAKYLQFYMKQLTYETNKKLAISAFIEDHDNYPGGDSPMRFKNFDYFIFTGDDSNIKDISFDARTKLILYENGKLYGYGDNSKNQISELDRSFIRSDYDSYNYNKYKEKWAEIADDEGDNIDDIDEEQEYDPTYIIYVYAEHVHKDYTFQKVKTYYDKITLGLTTDNKLLFWGNNENNPFNLNITQDTIKTPVVIAEEVLDFHRDQYPAVPEEEVLDYQRDQYPVSSQITMLITLKNKKMLVIGDNSKCELGVDNNGRTLTELTQVELPITFTQIYSYGGRTLGISDTGYVWGWGDNTEGIIINQEELKHVNPNNEPVDFSSLNVITKDSQVFEILPVDITEQLLKRFYKNKIPNYNDFLESFPILNQLEIPQNKLQDLYTKYKSFHSLNDRDYEFSKTIISNITKIQNYDYITNGRLLLFYKRLSNNTDKILNQKNKNNLMKRLLEKSKNANIKFRKKLRIVITRITNRENNSVWELPQTVYSVNKYLQLLKTFPRNIFEIEISDVYLLEN